MTGIAGEGARMKTLVRLLFAFVISGLVSVPARAETRYGVQGWMGTADTRLVFDRRQDSKGLYWIFTEANGGGLVVEHNDGSTDAIMFTGERRLRSVLEPDVYDRQKGFMYEHFVPMFVDKPSFDLGPVVSGGMLFGAGGTTLTLTGGGAIRARIKPLGGRFYGEGGFTRTRRGFVGMGLQFLSAY